MPRSVVLAVELLEELLDVVAGADELDVATDELVLTLELLVATEELVFELVDEELLVLELLATDELVLLEVATDELDEKIPLPEIGIEHSLALLLGMGSDPKVATLQVKVPFNIL